MGSSITGGIFAYAGNNLAHKAMLKDAIDEYLGYRYTREPFTFFQNNI